MSIQRCSERAFSKCPTRHLCGTRYEATFSDNSDCAEFNKRVDSMPITNADRIRAMSDNDLAKFLADKCVKASDQRICYADPKPTATEQAVIMHTWYCVWKEWLGRPAED